MERDENWRKNSLIEYFLRVSGIFQAPADGRNNSISCLDISISCFEDKFLGERAPLELAHVKKKIKKF